MLQEQRRGEDTYRHFQIHQYETQLHPFLKRAVSTFIPQRRPRQEIQGFSAVVGDMDDTAGCTKLLGEDFLVD